MCRWGFAASNIGRDCRHKPRIARFCQIRSSWALWSPFGIIVPVGRSSFSQPRTFTCAPFRRIQPRPRTRQLTPRCPKRAAGLFCVSGLYRHHPDGHCRARVPGVGVPYEQVAVLSAKVDDVVRDADPLPARTSLDEVESGRSASLQRDAGALKHSLMLFTWRGHYLTIAKS